MWVLQLAFVAFVFGIVNCFQWAAGILANESGRNFWRWYIIALFLPVISIVILLCLWDTDNNIQESVVAR